MKNNLKQNQSTRVNFFMNSNLHQLISFIAVLEHKNLTSILNEAVALYINEHPELAKIASNTLDKVKFLESFNNEE